jgi:hypothetical protein
MNLSKERSSKMKKFNLDDTYEIKVIDNKVYWVEAREWENQSFEYEDENEPVQVLTDYLHGECEIVDSGTLVLHPAKDMTRDDNDASGFYEELEVLPEWRETECFVTDLDYAIPGIRYCKNGNHIPFDYALYVMEQQLGYYWNSVTKRFEKEAENE